MEFEKRKIVHFHNEFVLFSPPFCTSLDVSKYITVTIFHYTIARISLTTNLSVARSKAKFDQTFKGKEVSFPRTIDRSIRLSTPLSLLFPPHEIKRRQSSSSREQRGGGAIDSRQVSRRKKPRPLREPSSRSNASTYTNPFRFSTRQPLNI